jgi:hypothetical protein
MGCPPPSLSIAEHAPLRALSLKECYATSFDQRHPDSEKAPQPEQFHPVCPDRHRVLGKV